MPGAKRRGDLQTTRCEQAIKMSSTGESINMIARIDGRLLCRVLFIALSLLVADSDAAGQTFQARLRVLTHNVFGFSPNNCKLREATFGNQVAQANPRYDIVGVQEYYYDEWGTCENLLNEIQATGRYPELDKNYWIYKPKTSGTIFFPSGGIGIFSFHPMTELADNEWDEEQDWFNFRQGFIFARIPIPGTPVTLDVYVTHMLGREADGCDEECHEKELLELRASIEQRAALSGNPVIVMGDFNLGGSPLPRTGQTQPVPCGNSGHDKIMSVLRNPRDLWLEAHSNPVTASSELTHPANRGFTRDCVENSILQCSQDAQPCAAEADQPRHRIDYIFVITHPSLTTNPYDILITDPNDVRLVTWRVPPPEDHHVSDHFGIEATFEIRGDPGVWVDFSHVGEEDGSPARPFNTLDEGADAAPSGSRVLIRPGSSNETLTISKALTLEAYGGTVTIGQ